MQASCSREVQSSPLQSFSQDRSKSPTKSIKGAMKIGLVDAMSWAKLSPAGLGSEASLEDGDHTHGYAASAFPVPTPGGLWGLTSRELTVWPEAAEGGREEMTAPPPLPPMARSLEATALTLPQGGTASELGEKCRQWECCPGGRERAQSKPAERVWVRAGFCMGLSLLGPVG